MSQNKFPGVALQEKRMALGLSCQDVYQQIHVPVMHIEALEEGDLAAMPCETYAMGFLQSYCQFLEIEAGPYMDQYRSWLRSQAQPRNGGYLRKTRSTTHRERPAWLRDMATWSAICAILLLGWLAYTVVVGPWAEHDQPRVQAGTTEEAPATSSFGDSW